MGVLVDRVEVGVGEGIVIPLRCCGQFRLLPVLVDGRY